jgi:hypothetical protein
MRAHLLGLILGALGLVACGDDNSPPPPPADQATTNELGVPADMSGVSPEDLQPEDLLNAG